MAHDAETTTDQVLEGLDLTGRRFLVTGASSGLGEESARALAAAGAAPLGAAAGELERFKAVVRIAEDEWILLQWAEGTLSMSETAWRRDNRIELQCRPGSSWSAEAWDQLWLRCQVS